MLLTEKWWVAWKQANHGDLTNHERSPFSSCVAAGSRPSSSPTSRGCFLPSFFLPVFFTFLTHVLEVSTIFRIGFLSEMFHPSYWWGRAAVNAGFQSSVSFFGFFFFSKRKNERRAVFQLIRDSLIFGPPTSAPLGLSWLICLFCN